MCPGAPRLVHSGPESPPLPLPGLPPPPPPPPTWLQPSAQAGPAGGREGAGRAEREKYPAPCNKYEGGRFKLQICLSSLSNSLFLHSLHREGRHLSDCSILEQNERICVETATVGLQ